MVMGLAGDWPVQADRNRSASWDLLPDGAVMARMERPEVSGVVA
jgi:hypothetical protein